MFAIRLLAITWLAGAIYVVASGGFGRGLFGTVSVVLALPAGIGLLMRQRWAVIPAMLLCVAWCVFGVVLMVLGGGVTLNNVSLVVGGVVCAIMVIHWHRTGRGAEVSFERM